MTFKKDQLNIKGSAVPMTILSSSISETAYSVTYYNRTTCCAEDPWLSINNHFTAGRNAGSNDETHSMLYGEASYNGWNFWRQNHQGANVFIRNSTVTPNAVPEPSALALLGLGLAGLGIAGLRRKTNA